MEQRLVRIDISYDVRRGTANLNSPILYFKVFKRICRTKTKTKEK